eukprot:15113014-Alexandrium_andersonii.AAC.1
MSASLVGSEMCIRDRLKPTSVVCGASRAWQRSQAGESLITRIASALTRCLLYTSDAADDM